MSTIRLLVCRDCRSAETIPDYHGDPKDDSTLEYAAAKHAYPNGERHFGRLYGGISEAQWGNSETQREILKRVWQEEGHTGMDPWVYQAMDTLRADAMQCWRERRRPETCADFHSDTKILVPPTAAERRSEGLPKWSKRNPHQQRYLCDYCPIRSVAEQKVRRQQGLYD
ncbi:hypothetical protein ACFVGM_08640 [Kitasatospora purpeofusca]|uniref:hypothetical protein n=1 Tax=Kitasatospora purpeofusca TaxID=67352 RepID=UPI0036D16959